MNKIKSAIPSPLFDGLQQILKHEDHQPKLTKAFQQDYERAKNFLLSYRGSVDTFNSYRRDIERFLQWCFLKANKTVKQIRRDEFEAFLDFCQNPPASWIATSVEDRFIKKDGVKIPNKKWKPFVVKISKTENKAGNKPNKKNYELSEKSFKALFAVIGSFYNYLIQEEYTIINPALLIRQKSKYFKKRKASTPIRRLSEMQWGYVIETAEIMAEENRDQHARTLFIMNALYGMYLRISELVVNARWTPTMGDFFRDADGLWWFLTVGKGNKERKISVSNAMLNALKEYRKSLKLPPLPSPNEKTPLFTAQKTNQPLKNTRYIRELVQVCFDRACDRLIADNQQEEADQLANATVHWLRHTGISDDVKTRPREHVRDDAGHSSSAITDKYIDVELRERHGSAKRKRIKPEFIEG
ncbi:MAG: tyrosine-type recombinase/integrase [Coxiellaceae bacterium]|nr:tyrosine-type recombinase/integrase [Coxiellaceae bacterium]